ncbi:MAG: glycosyltransferase [Actinomycetia bacterium]|nr:glycosyltransferase [Actinomycetes bacterium]
MGAEEKEDALLHGWYIMFLANSFTSVPEPSGGTKHFVELAKNWPVEVGQLSVMTTRIGIENCEIEGLSGPFRIVPSAWISRLGIMTKYLVCGVLALLVMPWRQSQLILYGTSDMLPDVLPAFIARFLKKKTSFWVNCVFHLIPPPRERAGSRFVNVVSFFAQRVSLKLIRKGSDMVVVDNALLKEELVELGFSPDKIFITYMGTEEPRPAADTSNLYDACYMGRLHPSKGIFDLVEIWRKVCEKRPGSKLAIVGTGPRAVMERLTGEVRAKDLDNLVEILGYIPRDELDCVLFSSSVFVLPSYEEGFGISLLEAMAHGLPAVAYYLPNYQEIFGQVLTTVPAGDTDGFASRVLELIDDEEMLRKKAHDSSRFASGYTWRKVTLREAGAIASAIRSRENEARYGGRRH